MKKILPSRLLPPSKTGLIVGGVILTGGAAMALYIANRPKTAPPAPTYDIVLPQRTPIEDLGGWRQSSPTTDSPAFAYKDEIESIEIIVSQQPIPEPFKGNVAAQVKQFAEGFGATTLLEANGSDAYIGRSASGPQWVIFTKSNTLVIIKSEKTISQADWVRYINSLVDPKTEQLPSF